MMLLKRLGWKKHYIPVLAMMFSSLGASAQRAMIVADNIGDYLKDTAPIVAQANGVRIVVRAGTTERALDMLDKNETDIAAITRELTAEESTKYSEMMAEPIASDALVFVVHPSNPLSNLSREEVEMIYSQSQLKWDKFLDSKHPLASKVINPISKTQENGAFKAFMRYFRFGTIQEKGKSLALGQYPNQKDLKMVSLVTTDDAVVAQLNARPESIAYVSLTALKKYENGKDFKIISFNRVEPSVKTTFNRSYPLTYRLNFVLSKNPTPGAKMYLDWILEAEGQDFFREIGFAPINLKTKIIQTTSSLTQFRRF